MVKRNNVVTVLCAATLVMAGLPAFANDYLIFSTFRPPDIGMSTGLTGVGGYVEDYGVPGTWGDEIQYVYFLSGNTGYKYRVWLTNHGGADDPTPTYINVKQHPGYPDPHNVNIGPVEPRHFELVSSADLTGYTAGSRRETAKGHQDEFHFD
ncbi:MAG TPA: hypothetical protein VFI27_19180, partial [candidate division Zixibacteria bacterium]|nr:hypothetical protein [candidate division Zixibacteria bacterium]